jgi:hypothetical protein
LAYLDQYRRPAGDHPQPRLRLRSGRQHPQQKLRARPLTYGYDNTYQLTSADNPLADEVFTYDLVGNRLTIADKPQLQARTKTA